MTDTRDPALREAVAVFESESDLQVAIDELLSRGFDRAEISLLASEHAVEQKLGHKYRKVVRLEDDPEAPRTAFVSTESLGDAEGSLIGAPLYVGATGGRRGNPGVGWQPRCRHSRSCCCWRSRRRDRLGPGQLPRQASCASCCRTDRAWRAPALGSHLGRQGRDQRHRNPATAFGQRRPCTQLGGLRAEARGPACRLDCITCRRGGSSYAI